jgi:hypothetical protein
MKHSLCIMSAVALLALGLTIVPGESRQPVTAQQPEKQSRQPLPDLPKDLEIRLKDPDSVATLIQAVKEIRQQKASLDKREKELLTKIKTKLAEQKKEIQDSEDLLKKLEAQPDQSSKSIQRMLRWTLAFNTSDGKDYAQQLRALGAVLAVEGADEPRKAMVYRDLSAPVKGEVEDLDSMKRIWWIDDKPESVSGLSRALGLKQEPKRLIVFLPKEWEEKLLRLELKHAEGKSEEEIKETVFEIRKTSDDKYEPVVVSQR